MEELILLRAVERLLAIVVGGLSIWFGFRLFLAIPDRPADGHAEISLSKNRRLLVSRIAPGIFFALFGTLAVIASFYFSTTLQSVEGARYSGLGHRSTAPFGANADRSIAPLDPATLSLTLAFLSDMEAELARHGTEDEAAWRARRFRIAKLAIMERNWQSDWGDFAEFEIWLDEGVGRSSRPEFERAVAVMEGRE